MKPYIVASALALLWATTGSASPVQEPVASSVLPTAETTQTILNSTHRHREWVALGEGATTARGFLVYPERADKAPVVVLSSADATASDRVRATADQLAAEGFIALAAQNLPEGQPALRAALLERAERYGAALPAASGKVARLSLDFKGGQAGMAMAGHQMLLPLGERSWRELVEHVSDMTGNRETTTAAASSGAPTPNRVNPRLYEKTPNLPASYYTAKATLANSKLRHEWVDIPIGGTNLRTWVVYPGGTAKTGVVIVMQHGVGLDDWVRSVADQLAADGFIAVAPDAWSGTGPNGGNRDSFRFDDEAIQAGRSINQDETQRRYKAARDWALKLPRANGKVGSIGFCAGGDNSFRFAAEVPDLAAAVVFYGGPPNETLMPRINAPVLGFYGQNDARITSTVAPTVETMRRLGKSYEPHIYPKVTHSFVYFQDLSVNREAVADAWPRVVDFYRKHLRS